MKNKKITARTAFVIAGLFLLILLPLACTSQEKNGDGNQNRRGGETVSDQKDQSPEPEGTGPGGREDEQGDGLIELTGKLSVKGSEPHTMLVLTTSRGEAYQIVGDLEAVLRGNFQYRTVTLRGEVVKEAIGPGFPAQFEAVEILNAS